MKDNFDDRKYLVSLKPIKGIREMLKTNDGMKQLNDIVAGRVVEAPVYFQTEARFGHIVISNNKEIDFINIDKDKVLFRSHVGEDIGEWQIDSMSRLCDIYKDADDIGERLSSGILRKITVEEIADMETIALVRESELGIGIEYIKLDNDNHVAYRSYRSGPEGSNGEWTVGSVGDIVSGLRSLNNDLNKDEEKGEEKMKTVNLGKKNDAVQYGAYITEAESFGYGDAGVYPSDKENANVKILYDSGFYPGSPEEWQRSNCAKAFDILEEERLSQVNNKQQNQKDGYKEDKKMSDVRDEKIFKVGDGEATYVGSIYCDGEAIQKAAKEVDGTNSILVFAKDEKDALKTAALYDKDMVGVDNIMLAQGGTVGVVRGLTPSQKFEKDCSSQNETNKNKGRRL